MSLSLFDLSTKIAIVTGSGQGIGKAIAKGMAAAGARVVVAARTSADIEATASEIQKAGGVAFPVPTDVTDSSQLENLVTQTINKFGRIDVLVNNAGGVIKVEPARTMSKELWEDHFSLNLTSVFMLSQLVGNIMIKQKKGSIINISSIVAEKPQPGRAAYSASKAAVTNLTIQLAIEWGRYNVRVNAIHPGFIATAKVETMYSKLPPEDRTQAIEFIPMKRLGFPEDIVGPAIFLASDASAYVNGAIIKVDGGRLAVAGKRREDESSLW